MRRPARIPKGRWSAVWDRAVAEVKARGEREPDRDLLERYVLNLWTATDVLKLARERPFVPGSQGQLVDHPGFRVAARCDALALQLATKLQLTPAPAATAKPDRDDDADSPPPPPPAAKPSEDVLDELDEVAAARAARNGPS